ncbi:response regulator transcription factor [Streptosporangium sp. NPDC023825]|uniref:response regulator transcription factor n=1 Tax=Streptosporangium sp. NPDC023825 TaxID=3154909 RepID=UPI00342BD8F3
MSTQRLDPLGRAVLVAMGSEVLRCGLRTMLATVNTVEKTYEAGDLDRALELLQSQRPDVLLLASSGKAHATEKLATVAAEHDAHVLLVLRGVCDASLAEAAALPVDGLLLETDLTQTSLRSALADLGSGLMPMPDPLARRLLARIRDEEGLEETPVPDDDPCPESDPIDSPLSSREQQALALMAAGLSNKQIARRLGISEHGAKRHVANILAKLNCSNRTLATAVALNRGLLPEPGR